VLLVLSKPQTNRSWSVVARRADRQRLSAYVCP
jgi:hypothetical protein